MRTSRHRGLSGCGGSANCLRRASLTRCCGGQPSIARQAATRPTDRLAEHLGANAARLLGQIRHAMLFDTIRRGRAVGAGQRPAAATWRLIRQACQRLSWGVADQAMSSLSNFAVNIYIARTLGAVQYGAFGLAYVTYGFALNASRGLATDPLLVRFSGTNTPTWRRAVARCTGTAATVGLTTGAIILA